jgi:hypothetical protein
MRRLLTLTVLLPVTAAVIFLGMATTPLFATTCTTHCSVAGLTCTPVNYCTSVPATSLDCDGTVTTCSVADAWCTCHYECIDSCEIACSFGPCGPCLSKCHQNNCGSTAPPPHTVC